MKKIYPKCGEWGDLIYESIGGVTNMISISFSGIKMLWLLGSEAPQTPSESLNYHLFSFQGEGE